MSIPPANPTALRLLQDMLLAGVAVVSGTAFHVTAGGRLPATASLLGLWLLATVSVSALVGRHPTRLRVLAAVFGAQGLLHMFLTGLAGHPVDVSPTAGAHDGHLDHATTALAASTHATPGSQLLMVVAHLVASAFVCWWMARGEHALWVLLRLSFRPLRAALAGCRSGWALAAALPGKVGTSLRCTYAAPGIIRVLSAHAVTRRGPPALVV